MKKKLTFNGESHREGRLVVASENIGKNEE
ncbi:uncharacterized protein G2W53_012586 [Senna tora]|uniref:Uncharacterized protein n=1 Tax=Senna tora TaxID=362788 RepID=A0A834WQQ6_9FABA|nr:uncharacterized protein G2W53_012586 [Senna tora]